MAGDRNGAIAKASTKTKKTGRARWRNLPARRAQHRGLRQRAKGVVRMDHLVFGVPDLARGIEFLEHKSGVRARFGGQHPGRGTHTDCCRLAADSISRSLPLIPCRPRRQVSFFRSSNLCRSHNSLPGLWPSKALSTRRSAPSGEHRNRRSARGLACASRRPFAHLEDVAPCRPAGCGASVLHRVAAGHFPSFAAVAFGLPAGIIRGRTPR